MSSSSSPSSVPSHSHDPSHWKHCVNSDDPRLCEWIRSSTWSDFCSSMEKTGESSNKINHANRAHIVFMGFPFDEGVKRNGGRVGAEAGPANVRKLMARMGTIINPELGTDLSVISITDIIDDLPSSLTLEEAHQKHTERVTFVLRHGCIPFIVGGGNDQSLANVKALLNVQSDGDIGVVNIDAHLDVRPLKGGLIHSGVPFRLMLEDERWRGRFIEFAAQGNQCSQVHADYVNEKKGSIKWYSQLVIAKDGVLGEWRRTLEELDRNIFVSFDIDAVNGADAPGVSAVATFGLSGFEATQMALMAGVHPRIRLFDVSEYNPKVEDWRTGRLVANVFYFFCCGVAKRYQLMQK